MDEWMQLNSGEATYRQQAQRAMRQPISITEPNGGRRRVRAILAAALIAVANRIAPAPAAPPSHSSAPLAPAQG